MLLPKGKLPDALLRRFVLRNLPVVRNPHQISLSRLGKSRSIVACVDPVAGVPMEFYGFFAVHYSASDVAVQGARPKYLILDISYPERTSSAWLERTTSMIGIEARKYDISILGGHTGAYDGISLPLISSTCIGYTSGRRMLGPRAVREGDKLLLAGELCLESAWLIASVQPHLVEKLVGRRARRRIGRKIDCLTALPKALAATKLGAKCLHDVAEGGLAAAIQDLCRATGRSIVVEENKLPFDKDSLSLIRSLGEDPLSASSFGALLMIAGPRQAERILSARGVFEEPVSVCGCVERGRKALLISDGRKATLKPSSDLYQKFSTRLQTRSGRKLDPP